MIEITSIYPETCDPDVDDCVDGYRVVPIEYVDLLQPDEGPPIRDPQSERDVRINELVAQSVASRRASLANTRYPCPIHRPQLFIDWREGRWPGGQPKRPMTPVHSPLADDEQLHIDLPYRRDTDG